ncbi:MAG: hypothetical protein H0T11_00440 [Chthoniobacterales bacterium]|nr:hypothetical protein [Chthoniobacterales bacterium]
MRIAFGLVGMLVTIGVIVMVMSMYLTKSSQDIKVGNKAREQVKQIGARSEDHTPAMDSFTTDAIMTGGKLDNLLVTAVVTGGAADKYFGLKKGDAIVEISVAGSLMRVSDVASHDAELAKASIVDAFSKSQQIVVVRDGKEITLPATAAPGAPPSSAGNALSQQLDAIQSQP